MPALEFWVDAGFADRRRRLRERIGRGGAHRHHLRQRIARSRAAGRMLREREASVLAGSARDGGLDAAGCWESPELWPSCVIVMTLERVGAMPARISPRCARRGQVAGDPTGRCGRHPPRPTWRRRRTPVPMPGWWRALHDGRIRRRCAAATDGTMAAPGTIRATAEGGSPFRLTNRNTVWQFGRADCAGGKCARCATGHEPGGTWIASPRALTPLPPGPARSARARPAAWLAGAARTGKGGCERHPHGHAGIAPRPCPRSWRPPRGRPPWMRRCSNWPRDSRSSPGSAPTRWRRATRARCRARSAIPPRRCADTRPARAQDRMPVHRDARGAHARRPRSCSSGGLPRDVARCRCASARRPQAQHLVPQPAGRSRAPGLGVIGASRATDRHRVICSSAGGWRRRDAAAALRGSPSVPTARYGCWTRAAAVRGRADRSVTVRSRQRTEPQRGGRALDSRRQRRRPPTGVRPIARLAFHPLRSAPAGGLEHEPLPTAAC